MRKIRFRLNGRQASLLSEKYLAEIREAFSFTAPSARYVPAFKLWLQQKALGVPEEDRQGWNGKKYLIDEYGRLPAGLLLASIDELKKKGFEVVIEEWKNKPKVEISKGFESAEEKYFYQNDAVHNMVSCIKDFGGGLVLAATGSGKTKIAAQFFSWVKGKCLFVVDQVDLLYQSQKEIQEWLSREGYDAKVGVVGNSKFEPERITVATIQTLHRHRKASRFKKWTAEMQVVIIDEVHVQMSRRNFSTVEAIEPQAVIGLTATMQLKQKPVRMKCFAICGPQVYNFPIEQGVAQGVLSQGAVVQVPVAPNPSPRRVLRIEKGKKVLEDDYTHDVVRNPNSMRLVGRLVSALREQDLCVVVLVDRIKHIKKLTTVLGKFEPKLFYGAIDVATRKKQLKQFDSGKEDLIIANRVFTKGVNLKRIDVVIDGAQRSSRNDCIQKYGRAVRLHTEKAGVWYIDIFTEGKMEKAAKNRYGAFKKAKIPIKRLTSDFTRTDPWSPKEIISEVDILLREALKKNKPTQGRLF